jgi:acyl-[acyl-carrier-protein]-phospholipid O-acyltransferase/long-chain-fatty-acid--[acyl-carrier-protein] ligase
MTRAIERMARYRDPSPPDDPQPRSQPTVDFESLPTLYRDRAFWGMTITQFLGAFNDSVFKQLVLFLTVQVVALSAGVYQLKDWQWVAQAVFAGSFVLFSGVAGLWADRLSKRTIVVSMKVVEIGVMLAGVAAFALMAQRLTIDVAFSDQEAVLTFQGEAKALLDDPQGLGKFQVAGDDGRLHEVEPQLLGAVVTLRHPQGRALKTIAWGGVTRERASQGPQPGFRLTREMPWLVIVVLFFMGAHSAVFGPAKYGILPEMVRARDLPRFNGMIQMTTFLALIFGFVLAGYLMDHFADALWASGLVCMLIAVVGTSTSFLVRRTPVAQPDAKFSWRGFWIAPDTQELLANDPPLRAGLLVYSLFWFVAAAVPLSITALGQRVLSLTATQTGLLLACISIGIAAGCVLAGRLSRDRVNFGLVRCGTWGMLVCMVLLSLPGVSAETLAAVGIPAQWIAWLPGVNEQHLLGYRGSQIVLAVAGLFAGLLAVPLQVYLQAKPPEALKGRMIGTMNLINWIGIILSTGFYAACESAFKALNLPTFFTFGATGLLILLPIAVVYRPPDEPL